MSTIMGLERVSIEKLVNDVRDLPALPDVALKVLRMTELPDVSAKDVAKVIATDQAFTARVLRLSNSAHYGMPRSITTVTDAAVLLGMRSLRTMAITAATYDLLKRELKSYMLGRGELWRHSVGCAIATQILAKRTGYRAAEEAFVAGLLHDVGKVILHTHLAKHTDAVAAMVEAGEMTFCEVERELLGFDHAEVGGRVAEKWNLPPSLVETISEHHEPVRNGKVAPLTALVHLSNAICVTAGIGVGVSGASYPLCNEALHALNLKTHDLEATLAELMNVIVQQQPMFDLENAVETKK